MSEPAGEISLTIKHTGKFEAPWTVFRGTAASLKSQLIEFYQLGAPETFADWSTNSVFLEATVMAEAEYLVREKLGGKPVSISDDKPKGKPAAKKSVSKTARKTAQSEKDSNAGKVEPAADSASVDDSDAQAKEGSALTDQLNAATTVKELQDVWAKNQAAFKEKSVMDAYKARGKELSA